MRTEARRVRDTCNDHTAWFRDFVIELRRLEPYLREFVQRAEEGSERKVDIARCAYFHFNMAVAAVEAIVRTSKDHPPSHSLSPEQSAQLHEFGDYQEHLENSYSSLAEFTNASE